MPSASGEAEAYRRLIEEFGYTQRSLAKLVGRSQPHISRRLSLLDLPEKVRADLDTGSITLPDAVELAPVPLRSWGGRGWKAMVWDARHEGGHEHGGEAEAHRGWHDAVAKAEQRGPGGPPGSDAASHGSGNETG